MLSSGWEWLGQAAATPEEEIDAHRACSRGAFGVDVGYEIAMCIFFEVVPLHDLAQSFLQIGRGGWHREAHHFHRFEPPREVLLEPESVGFLPLVVPVDANPLKHVGGVERRGRWQKPGFTGWRPHGTISLFAASRCEEQGRTVLRS